MKWGVAGALLLILVGGFVLQRMTSDERRIERTIELVATGSDPGYCDEKVTDAYLEHVVGARLPFADEICELAASQPAADEVDVGEVSVDGDRATARVTFTGGLLDGSEVLAGLVKTDGDWRVDRLSVARLNRARFRRAYERYLRSFASKGGLRCALSRERRLTDSEAGRFALEDGPDGMTGAAVACDRASVEGNIVEAFAASAVDRRGVRCARRTLASADDVRVLHVQLDPGAYGDLIATCDPGAILDQFAREVAAEEDGSQARAECVVARLRGLPPNEQFRLGYEDDRFEALLERCA